jgi:hypothetical protein
MHRMNQSDAPGNRMSNICDVNLSEATPALFADYLSTQGANGVVFNDKLAASLGASTTSSLPRWALTFPGCPPPPFARGSSANLTASEGPSS